LIKRLKRGKEVKDKKGIIFDTQKNCVFVCVCVKKMGKNQEESNNDARKKGNNYETLVLLIVYGVDGVNDAGVIFNYHMHRNNDVGKSLIKQ